MISKKIILLFCFFVILNCISSASDEKEQERSLSRQKRKILFPQFTVLQISMCLVAQVSHITSHKFAVNTGFQINYAMPYNLKQFYMPIFWGRSNSNDSTSLFNSFFNKLIESDENENEEETTIAAIEETTIEEEEDDEEVNDKKQKQKRDVTAGEFYNGIRETLPIAGYDEECLLRSVCELAKHPLTVDKENIIHQIVHFILTPSEHASFDEKEELEEKKMFEEAEAFGKSDGDCELKYQKCDTSPLHAISHFEVMSE